MSDKITAIILARGGSKGIPNKNILDFLGKPLVAWSVIQAKITSHYDKMVHTTRKLVVPATDKELFKRVARFLQVEKAVKKSKVYKVLTGIMKTAENCRTERLREEQQPQQTPAQTTTSTVKYKAAELTCSVLKFPPTPFELIEWKDNM